MRRPRSIAETINANTEELSSLVTLEQRKPLSQVRLEAKTAANAFDYYSTLFVKQEELKNDGVNRVVRDRCPVGVIGPIVAWNFPLSVLAWKLASAPMDGNATVFDEGGVLHESSNDLPNLPGHSMNPTIATGLTQNSRLVQEE